MLLSTLLLILIICIIIGSIIVRKKLRKKQIKSEPNVNDIVSKEEYDDIYNEYDQNYYLRMNFNLDNYDIGVYHQINYDQLNVETNESVEYTQILQ
jgi:ABC-type transport system involved in multi-copper enzyme maturation permease subunit